jgi:ATP phosphoribosyltransferase regulatory subunit
MAGKTSAEREALDAQNRRIMAVFTRAGFDFIAPDIVQPADMFLESSGESIRSRTYVFTDPAGAELCLRPDLTVPACRYHLSHAKDVGTEARYCYSGPAFRFSAQAQPSLNPTEFDQAGIEWFSAATPMAAEAEVLHLALKAVEAAGLKKYRVRNGDLGLFRALLHSIAMPERWRSQLLHQYWRPKAFRDLLDLLTGEREKSRSSISVYVDAIAGLDERDALAYVEKHLLSLAVPLTGGRRLEEIAGRLLEKVQDRSEKRLSPETRRRIDDYLAIEAPLVRTAPLLEPLAQNSPGLEAALDRFSLRLRELKRRRIDLETAIFSASFGRNLEYYTGFVFEVEADIAGTTMQVAGGGRYDSLMADIGSPVAIPAVGCAIHTERLLAAVRRQA